MLWYLLFTQKGSKMSEKSIERDTWDGIFVFHIWYGQHNTGSTCKYYLKKYFICENYAKLWYYSNLVFLCLFARTCPNTNMTEWLPNLWIFWTSCTHRKRTCSNWLTGLRYSKELNFYFPQLLFVVTCKHKVLQ